MNLLLDVGSCSIFRSSPSLWQTADSTVNLGNCSLRSEATNSSNCFGKLGTCSFCVYSAFPNPAAIFLSVVSCSEYRLFEIGVSAKVSFSNVLNDYLFCGDPLLHVESCPIFGNWGVLAPSHLRIAKDKFTFSHLGGLP
jgi:hypothetical protein